MAFKLYTSGHKFHIIVGKGHNSRRHIQGKNPLRFYTEEYLQILGLRFYQAPEWQGGSGVIITEI